MDKQLRWDGKLAILLALCVLPHDWVHVHDDYNRVTLAPSFVPRPPLDDELCDDSRRYPMRRHGWLHWMELDARIQW